MKTNSSIGIDRATFLRLSGLYRQRWSIGLCAVGIDGQIVYRSKECPARSGPDLHQAMRLAVDEALSTGAL